MRTTLELNTDEIKEAIRYWIENTKSKKVCKGMMDFLEISLSHIEDDRASGVFNYYADIKIENY